MQKLLLLLAGLLAGAMLLAGCSSQESPLAPQEDITSPPQGVALAPRAVIAITSAQFNVFVGFANQQVVTVHRITTDWEPATTTWNSFGGAFDPASAGSFVADLRGWREVDITELVASWASGGENNFGILLAQSSPAPAPTMLHSREMNGYEPFLVLDYVTSEGPASDTVIPTADLFIDQAAPDMNTEGGQILLVGVLTTSGSEKQALLRFDVPSVNSEVTFSDISGQTWEDVNQDGIRDTGEAALSGVTVKLYNCDGFLLDSVTTGGAGDYRFDSLTAGDYLLEFTAPAGYQFSPANQGGDDSNDSDADPNTGRTDCVPLGEGESAVHWDAGLYVPTEEVDTVCTHGKGYWRNRAGRSNEVDSLLPLWLGEEGGEYSVLVDSAAFAEAILSMKVYGKPSNGIVKLYAHLLATKLNIAAGAADDDIAEIVAAADAFLAAQPWEAWDDLEREDKKLVLYWKDKCEMYNEGEIGPGSCDGLAEAEEP